MKNTIKEFIEPTNKEKQELWQKAVFDTNVLLNLYRYSAKTRKSLLAAFENFKDRVWIPYQVAYEYMRKRCEVIYETVQRYEQFKKEMENFTNKAVVTLRLTSGDEEVSELKRYLFKWLDSNKDRNLLVVNADEDEILDKILTIFDGRVGLQIDEKELNAIKEEGEKRYKQSIPPGFKDDKKKKNSEDDNNAYGDLIIWKQIIKYAKENGVGIVYVTHDQKEDPRYYLIVGASHSEKKCKQFMDQHSDFDLDMLHTSASRKLIYMASSSQKTDLLNLMRDEDVVEEFGQTWIYDSIE